MIELTFQTADGPIVIQFATPVATPGDDRPWAIAVRLDGRPSKIVGEDPLEALALGALFASSYLSGREGLDPPVNDRPWKETPDILAHGFREGILAVLDVRGIPCPDTARARIAACADPWVLQRCMARAKTAATVDDVFADVMP